MLSIDPDDEEDEDGEGGTKKTVAPPPVTTADQPASDGIPKPVVISASGDNNSVRFLHQPKKFTFIYF